MRMLVAGAGRRSVPGTGHKERAIGELIGAAQEMIYHRSAHTLHEQLSCT